MTNSVFFIFTFGFLSFFTNTIVAQSGTQNKNLYKTFDSIIGDEVSGLYNGVQYNNDFIVLEGKHQFLDTNDFSEGYVRYDNQHHYKIYIKYDLFYDEIIVRPQNSSGGLAFKLIKSLVDGFVLFDKKFVHIKARNQKTNEPIGYCEQLSETEFLTLYKKQIKKSSKKAKGAKIFYEFNQSNTYIIEYNNTFFPAAVSKDLISIFPDQKNVIKDYYRAYKKLLKSDPDTFFKLLLTRLNEVKQLKTA
ncbi:hypothetical protein KIM67_13675 [Flagellimonas sp. 389]|uniref:hypothetical protein n=1 Tax=Flagellimonas sp. 389 TaxID=2835862 RepID=UPI001BD42487|nr:hypothetical protein [Flagellimonas sp. 389]MBS9463462.1 hypothetical protein [Flagellimonas sp. 389]